MRPLRVLHIINTLGIGGAEMTLVRLVERLQSIGYSNTILTLAGPNPLTPRLEAVGAGVEGLGLEIGRMPGPAVLWRLRQAFRRHRPDLVQGWLYHGNLAASAGSWIAASAAPVIWNIRNSLTGHHQLKPMTRWVIRASGRLGRSTAAMIYCSAASAPQHERLGFPRAKRIVIPNGIDCEVYRPRAGARAALKALCSLSEEMPIIGLAARYHPNKGHAVLIRAFARLLATGRTAHLVLVGAGLDSDNHVLTGLIGETKIAGHVTLAGERRDVPDLLPGLDVACLPSFGEGWPNFLGEAMASGVPCVATDVGDVRDILGYLGPIVTVGDIDGLAGALAAMLDKTAAERRTIGLASRRRIENDFSFGSMIDNYDAVYRKATDAH